MEENTQKTRPTFLTVLCILTFIGSGWGIIDGTIDFFSADVAGEAMEIVDEEMEEALEEMEDSEMTDAQRGFVEKLMGGVSDAVTPENIRKASIVGIVSSILCLFGAIRMWGLRKMGYYIYIGGTLISIIGAYAIFGGAVGAIAAAGSGFIGLVFIILYGVNVKHMS